MARSRAARDTTSMNIRDIKSLIDLMVANDLTEVDIADGDSKVHLKRGGPAVSPSLPAALPAAAPALAAAAAPAAEAPKENLLEIRSPMVGTFYAAPSPDSETYVKMGSAVGEDAVVCIIEAMKVMNEIRAEVAGVIAEICVKNAQPVEYGQVLFRVKSLSE